jgi:hypothetical protein
MEAIQQAVREPLVDAPHDYQKFAIYIFERAREIDREMALTRSGNKRQSPSHVGSNSTIGKLSNGPPPRPFRSRLRRTARRTTVAATLFEKKG